MLGFLLLTLNRTALIPHCTTNSGGLLSVRSAYVAGIVTRPPHPMVRNAVAGELDRIVKVAAIEDDLAAQKLRHPLEVQQLELVPFGDHSEGIGAVGGIIGILAVDQAGQDLLGVLHG